ncbi:MAG: deoxyribonuclease IV [Candidatus Saccharibacteria bacterium]
MLPRIGAHLSIGKGLPATAENAVKLGVETFQVFSRNPRGASSRTWSEDEVSTFRQIIKENNIDPVVVHIPYIVNPCSGRDDLYELAHRIIAEDLVRCDIMGARYLVLHPGSRGDQMAEEALERLVNLLKKVLSDYDGETMILVETMAGMGKEIGTDFADFKAVLDGVNRPDKLGVCIDTCHLTAAGHDVRTAKGIQATIKELGTYIDTAAVKVVHANDSSKDIGSKVDRHAPIGAGFIGTDGFNALLANSFMQNLPFILETPPDTIEQDLAILRDIRQKVNKK